MAILTAMAIRLFYLLDCIPWLRRPRTSHRRLCTRDHIYFSGGKGGERVSWLLFPTAELLIEATDIEIERVVLLRVAECCADPMRRMVARDSVTIELFERGGYDYDVRKRTEVEKSVARAWKRLEDVGLIEEPDFENGKNGFRLPSGTGYAVAASFDFAAAMTRGTFNRKMFHPLFPDAAWHAFRAGTTTPRCSRRLKQLRSQFEKRGLA